MLTGMIKKQCYEAVNMEKRLELWISLDVNRPQNID